MGRKSATWQLVLAASFVTLVTGAAAEPVTGTIKFFNENRAEVLLPIEQTQATTASIYSLHEPAGLSNEAALIEQNHPYVTKSGDYYIFKVSLPSSPPRIRFHIEFNGSGFRGQTEMSTVYTHTGIGALSLEAHKIAENRELRADAVILMRGEADDIMKAFDIQVSLFKSNRNNIVLDIARTMSNFGDLDSEPWPAKFEELIMLLIRPNGLPSYSSKEKYAILTEFAYALNKFDQNATIGGNRRLYNLSFRLYDRIFEIMSSSAENVDFSRSAEAVQGAILLACNQKGIIGDCVRAFERTMQARLQLNSTVLIDLLTPVIKRMNVVSGLEKEQFGFSHDEVRAIESEVELERLWRQLACVDESYPQIQNSVARLEVYSKEWFIDRLKFARAVKGDKTCNQIV